MQHFTIGEILDVTSSTLFFQNIQDFSGKKYRVTHIDNSRYHSFKKDVFTNAVFIPIAGKTFNVLEKHILEKNLKALLISEHDFKKPEIKNLIFEILEKHKHKLEFILISKMRPHDILYKFVRYTRAKKISPKTKFIVVTGTVGKTTTTEMLYNVLKQETKAYRGIPETNIKNMTCQKILDLPEDEEFDYVVLEVPLGSAKGTLGPFIELINFDIAVVTKISLENTNVYETLDKIAAEKCTTLSTVGEDGFAILNDQEVLRKTAASYDCKKFFLSDQGDNYKLILKNEKGSVFEYDGLEYEISSVGEHHISNAIKVIAVAKKLGISTESIQKGLKEKATIGSRWVVNTASDKLTIISDVANNSTESTLKNLKTFAEIYADKKVKRAVLTHMRTIANQALEIYPEIAKEVVKFDYQEIIFFGSEANFFAECVEKLSNGKIKVTKIGGKQTWLQKDDEIVNYLASTVSEGEALLIKTDADINHRSLASYILEKLV